MEQHLAFLLCVSHLCHQHIAKKEKNYCRKEPELQSLRAINTLKQDSEPVKVTSQIPHYQFLCLPLRSVHGDRIHKAAFPRTPIAGCTHQLYSYRWSLCTVITEAQSRGHYWDSEGPPVSPPWSPAQEAVWCRAWIPEADWGSNPISTAY